MRTKIPQQQTNQITGRKRWFALGAVMLTMFFSAMDQTVVSTAMPTIIGTLKGFSLYAWVFTAYMMASAVTVPIYGKLSDIYGRKPFYIFGLTMFMIGSMISGQAVSMGMLIASRAIQGIGGGAMLSMPRATIGDIFNPRERGRWMGAISSIFGLASIVGPFVGGWITDTIGWRWIFYINLPFGVIAAVTISLALPRVRTGNRTPVDWGGSVLLMAGLVPILLALTWADTVYGWGSWKIISLLSSGAAFILLFVFNERRAQEPIISPHLFSNPVFSISLAVGLLVSMGMFGSLMFLPLFIQGVLGLHARDAGAILTPMMLSFVAGSIAGGQIITRTGKYKIQALAGTAAMVLGMFLLFRMGTHTRWPQVVINMLVVGVSIGVVFPLLSVAIQNAFPYRIMGVVNSTQQFVRSLGGVIAAPVLGTMLTHGFGRTLNSEISPGLRQALYSLPAGTRAALLHPQGLTNPQALEALRQDFTGLGDRADHFYAQFIDAVRAALAASFHNLFMLTVVFAAVAFIVTCFLREIPLKRDEYYR